MSESSNNFIYMRLLNASPDSPAFDVYINNKIYASAFKYRDFTEYFSGQPGTYNIKIYPANNKTNLLIDRNIDLYKNNIYTVALMGLYDLGNLDINLISDHSRNTSKRYAYIRFVNLSPTSDELDIKLNNNLVVSDLSYGTQTNYLELEPKIYNLKVYLQAENQETLILQNPQMRLSANKIYSGYIIGTYNKDSNKMQILLPLEGATYIKF